MAVCVDVCVISSKYTYPKRKKLRPAHQRVKMFVRERERKGRRLTPYLAWKVLLVATSWRSSSTCDESFCWYCCNVTITATGSANGSSFPCDISLRTFPLAPVLLHSPFSDPAQSSAQCCTLSKGSTAACRHRLYLLDPTGILEPRMHTLHYRCVWKRCPCFVYMVILDSYIQPEPQTSLPSLPRTKKLIDRPALIDRCMHIYTHTNIHDSYR